MNYRSSMPASMVSTASRLARDLVVERELAHSSSSVVRSRQTDLNRRPSLYKSAALPLSYAGISPFRPYP